ncbi:heme-degrading domain-containing protein [Massilia sp. CCM 8692]|uniref:Heme-degrading domain-containing protein n=2 Tax=Massilia rubra TaxID=2607910 RepID=A0ABX0LQT7_9BURK|nr:heme-degrading domain-containing protein [Massilia rubra]
MLAMLVRQERLLQFDVFNSDIALEIGLRLVRAARARNQAITVDITRHGQRLFYHAMNGTPADHAHWIWRKSNLVKRTGHSSYHVHTQVTVGGGSIHAIPTLDPRQFAALGGAFPLTIRGSGVAGTITVAGLPGAEDHALVVGVLREYLKVDEML